jgi:uncharacterized protein (DUF2062 family)
MPRRLIRKFAPHPYSLRKLWFFRIFGERLAHMHIWSTRRRAITAAFGAGLAICFVPLPVHLPLGLLVALLWRLNLPVLVATTVFVVNPLTVVPVYYAAYRVGAALVGQKATGFAFQLSWDWLQNGLGPLWKPFLTGCLICAFVLGYGAYLALELIWRWNTVHRLRVRRRQDSR